MRLQERLMEERLKEVKEVRSNPLLLSSLELSDTQVYAPQIRALLGTASHARRQLKAVH